MSKEPEEEDPFQYEFDFDLKALHQAIQVSIIFELSFFMKMKFCQFSQSADVSAEHQHTSKFDESGYQSVLARSAQSNFGTGWLIANSCFDEASQINNQDDDDWS